MKRDNFVKTNWKYTFEQKRDTENATDESRQTLFLLLAFDPPAFSIDPTNTTPEFLSET